MICLPPELLEEVFELVRAVPLYECIWDSAPLAKNAQSDCASIAAVCRSFSATIQRILFASPVVDRPSASLLLRSLTANASLCPFVRHLQHSGIERAALNEGASNSYYLKLRLMDVEVSQIVALLPKLRSLRRDPMTCDASWRLAEGVGKGLESLDKIHWLRGPTFGDGADWLTTNHPRLQALSLTISAVTTPFKSFSSLLPLTVHTLSLDLPRHFALVSSALSASSLPNVQHLHLHGPTSHFESPVFQSDVLPSLLPQLRSLAMEGTSKAPRLTPIPLDLRPATVLETLRWAGFDIVFETLSSSSLSRSPDPSRLTFSPSLIRLHLGWRDFHTVAEKTSTTHVRKRLQALCSTSRFRTLSPGLREVQDFGLSFDLALHRNDRFLWAVELDLDSLGVVLKDRLGRIRRDVA